MIDNAHQLTEPWAAYALLDNEGDGWMVVYVEKDKPGYWPTTYKFADPRGEQRAKATADSINETKGLSRSEALDIVSSSIAASNKEQG